MGEWAMYFVVQNSPYGAFRPMNLGFSIANSDQGDMSCEIALSDPLLETDLIGPYRTDYTLFRGANIITSGIVTSVNLNKDRDTILVGGNDWLHYLKRRIYPFDPVLYKAGDWRTWPKKWVDEDLVTIVQDILQAMIDADSDPLYVPDFGLNNGLSGKTARYKIYPADRSWVYDHINTLSQMEDGFEFAISPTTLEFFMYFPDRDSGNPIYTIESTGDESSGQITNFDWNNVGPRGTWTLGLGSGGRSRSLGAIKTDPENKAVFRRLDVVEDFGEVSSQDMLNRKTAYQGSTNLGPEKTLALSVLNPEFMAPNFYTGGRPRNLIGNRIRAKHTFLKETGPYRTIDAYWRVQKLGWRVDNDSNEIVDFDIEMIAPRLV